MHVKVSHQPSTKSHAWGVDITNVWQLMLFIWQRAQRGGKKVVTFGFVRFAHYCDRTTEGASKLWRKATRKRFIGKLKEMNKRQKNARNLVGLKERW